MSKYIDEAGVQQLWEKTKERMSKACSKGITCAIAGGGPNGYFSTVDYPDPLDGTMFIIIPDTSNHYGIVTLNINNTGDEQVFYMDGYGSASWYVPANVMQAYTPMFVHYSSAFGGWVLGRTAVNINEIHGEFGVDKGGTGLTTIRKGNYMVGNGSSPIVTKTAQQVASDIQSYLPTETWKFTLADGSVVEKKVVVLP